MKHTYLDQSIDDKPRVKVMLDADVLLELFVNRSGFVEDVERLLAEIEASRQVEVYITDKCLKRISIEDDLGDEASSFVEKMVRGRIIKIDSDIRALARVSDLQDYDSAEELACAKNEQLNAIITLNPQNFDGSTLPIWSVANLLKRVSLEKSLEKDCKYQDFQLLNANCFHFVGHGKFKSSKNNNIDIFILISTHITTSAATTFEKLIILDACNTAIEALLSRSRDTIVHSISTEPKNQAEKGADLNQANLQALKLSEESETDASLNSDSQEGV